MYIVVPKHLNTGAFPKINTCLAVGTYMYVPSTYMYIPVYNIFYTELCTTGFRGAQQDINMLVPEVQHVAGPLIENEV